MDGTAPALADKTRQALAALGRAAGGPILAIETSTVQTSLCLVGFAPDAVEEVNLDRNSLPSEALAEFLAQRLHNARPALAAIVVGVGPGSFTGLRVGLATAKGIAFGFPETTKLYGVSSLAVWAASAGPGQVAVAVDARRGELYTALYAVDDEGVARAVLADRCCPASTFAVALAEEERSSKQQTTAMVGDAEELLSPVFDQARPWSQVLPRASTMLIHESARIRSRRGDSLESLVPQYLRLSTAERALKARS